MNAKDVIRQVIQGGHRIVRGYVADLSDAELLIRPAPGANHIAWQLGHLIEGSRRMLGALGQPVPAVPAGFEAAHARDGTSSKCDEPGRFLGRAEYVALLDGVLAASLAAVDAIPDKALDNPAPEPFNKHVPTVGGLLALQGTHLLMHAGQFVPVRRKLNKPVAF